MIVALAFSLLAAQPDDLARPRIAGFAPARSAIFAVAACEPGACNEGSPASRASGWSLDGIAIVAGGARASGARDQGSAAAGAGAQVLAPARVAIFADVVRESGARDEREAAALQAELAREMSFVLGVTMVAASEVDSRVRGCGSDSVCVAGELRRANIDVGVTALVNRSVDPPLAASRVVVAKGDVVIARTLSEEDPMAVPGAIARQVVGALEEVGFRVGGRVVLEGAPANAVILIDGRSPISPLAVGEHEIVVRSDGYSEFSTRVMVKRGVETPVVISLEEHDSSMFASPWFWIVAGVVVSAGSAAVLLASGSDESPYMLCQTNQTGLCR